MPVILMATDAQREIIEHPAKAKFFVAGRRVGKTTTAELYVTKIGLEHPHQDSEVICPKYSQAIKVYIDFKRSKGFMENVKRTSLSPVPHFELVNGHIVYFRSMDRPETLKGGPLILAVVDECSQMKWSDITEHIFIKLSDLRGTLLCCGTLLGENGWLWKKYQQYKDGSNPMCMSWLYPTWTNTLRYGGAEGLARLKFDKSQVSREQWRQEFCCIPSAAQGGVFRWIKDCIHPKDQAPTYTPYNFGIVAGVDIAKTNDHTAVVVLLIDYRQDIAHVVHAERIPRNKKWETIVDEVGSILSRFGDPIALLDSTGGAKGGQTNSDAIIPLFLNNKKIKRGQPFYWTGDNKPDIIEYLALCTEKQKIRFYDHQTDLLDEMAVYQRIHRGFAAPEYCAPRGFHDDLVSALASAVHGWRHGNYSKNIDTYFSSASWH